MATTRRTHMRRALACTAAAACCVVGVSSPSYAHQTPVPVPPSPVSRSPELPVLPGHEIKMEASLAPSASDDMGVGERVSVSELRIILIRKYPSPKITLDECTMLANTFWSGSAPNYHSTVDYNGGICILTAHYANDARHAFYSLDEDGTITARAPMVYLHQIASSFETVHFTRFDYWFSAIVNTQCNADPSYTWGCAQVVDGLFMRLLSRPLGVVRIRWGICRRGWCGCGGGCRSLRSRWRPRCRPGRGW